MVRESRRTGLSGPLLVRLLTRLSQVDVIESGRSASDCLSQWLGWTDAIALSAVLSGAAPPASLVAPAVAGDVTQTCEALRATLVQAILNDENLVSAQRRWLARASAVAVADYSMYRQRYLNMQQTMERDIGGLRARLRDVLASGGAEHRRLAALDALMEQILNERESQVLAGIPSLLESYFERLQRGTQADEVLAAPVKADWQDTFRTDMRRVLLAELDIRWQPVAGLLAAVQDGELAAAPASATGA